SRFVGFLRGIHERRGNIEPPNCEPDVRVRLPYIPDGFIASRRHLIFRRPAFGLREFHLSLSGPTLEEVPLQKEPCAAARLGGTEPSRRLISSSDFEPAGERIDIGYQRECREIGCAGAPPLGFLSPQHPDLGDQVRPSLERLVDYLIDRVL